MSTAEFHLNVAANVIGAAVFAFVVWYIVRARGTCPLCGRSRGV